jgi:hypothetical protein
MNRESKMDHPARKQPSRAGFGRLPWERILRIHERIQSGRHPNCVRLAAEFEVSPRTLKRDVEFMKDRMRLPIEYDPRRWGYYYARPVERYGLIPRAASVA